MSADDHTTSVEFRPIPGFPGYRAGSDGTIETCWKMGRQPATDKFSDRWRPRRPFVGVGGYLSVTLRKDGKGIPKRLAGLIMLAFYGPPPEGMEIRHLDSDVRNNRLENLRYSTHVENESDKIHRGTKAMGERHGGAKLTAELVARIREMHAEGVSEMKLAKQFGMSSVGIHHVCARNTWKHVL